MRRLLVLCTLVTLGAGCEDAVGPGGDCSREMQEVRRSEGQPVSTNEVARGPDYATIWRYEGRVYTFRWGVSHNGCEVESSALNLLTFTLT